MPEQDLPPARAESEPPDTDELLALAYEELCRLARLKMSEQRKDHTLQATALVHEAYLRLAQNRQGLRLSGRRELLALASRAMRSVLVDHARAKCRQKRGSQARPLPLDAIEMVLADEDVDLVALDEALRRLATFDPQMEQVVVLRWFGGVSMKEIARMLGWSVHQVYAEWEAARVWLRAELEEP